MTKQFYKDVKILQKRCKAKGCIAWYRPEKGTWHARLGFCFVHRKTYYRNWYFNHFMPWFEKLPAEKKAKFRAMQKKAWDKWVANNINRRRSQALASYHKNKEKHRKARNERRRAAYAALKKAQHP